MDGWLLDIASAVTSGCILTVNLTACTRHRNKCQQNSTRRVARVFKPPRGAERSVRRAGTLVLGAQVMHVCPNVSTAPVSSEMKKLRKENSRKIGRESASFDMYYGC
jgi:hypothetical protein